MGLFAAVGSVFGNGVGKFVEKGVKLADEYVLTKEEDAELFMEFVKATVPSNVSRRILASVIAGVWAFSALNVLFIINMNIFFDLAKGALDDGSALLDYFQYVSLVMGTVVSWYFWKGVKAQEK